MVAYVTTMPSGIQGQVSRIERSVVESQVLNPTYPFATFGIPVKYVAGKALPLVANDAMTLVQGFLAREFMSQTALNEGLGVYTPPTTGVAGVMRSGYMTVVNNAGTPALAGQVFIRTANPSGSLVIGGVEATFVGASTAVAGSNTGNGTISAVTTAVGAFAGTYKATFTAATAFSVTDPNGNVLAPGATGVAYSNKGIGFTITAGATPFVAGDSFTITTALSTQVLPGAEFMGPADSAGNVEISFNV
jgi:hypothetical protein